MMAEEVMDILRSNIDTLWVIDCAITKNVLSESTDKKLADDLTLISIGK
jgi:hypothetical protein